ncbi:MAG: dockerin type I domain-containing protein [Pirellulales bacterium]
MAAVLSIAPFRRSFRPAESRRPKSRHSEKWQVSLRLIAFAVVVLLGSLAPLARGDDLTLQLFPFTGEVRLANPNATTFSFVIYSLSSDAGALNSNPAVWKSITDTYDRPAGVTPGNGYIDPLHDWFKIRALPTELTEGVILNPGGSLAPFRSVSLGKMWNPHAVASPDVTAEVADPNHQLANVAVDLAIDGDYNQNGAVDMADYNVWKLHFGETATIDSLKADGNLDGVVDAGDYTIWRNNLGLDLADFVFGTSSGGATGLGIGNVVPEPSAVVLLLTLAGFAALMRRLH